MQPLSFFSAVSFLRPRKVEQVDFVVAGVQKAGTTALHDFISHHPEIVVLRDQALHFFDNEENFSDEPDYEILHRNFRLKRGWKIAGEVTNDYIFWRPALARIARYHPAMKLIVLLRDPITRAFSDWNMRRANGQEQRDFLEALAADRPENFDPISLATRRFSYVGRGLYFEQMHRVFQFFPREQVLTLKYEVFRANFAETMNQVFDFLEVKRLDRLTNRERNVAAYPRGMTPEERAQASIFFEDDTRQLETLLGWDCSAWRASAS